MKNRKYIYAKITLLTVLLFGMTISCERPLSNEAEYAIYPQIGDIFADNVVGMGTDFYFPFAGSKATAWSVDDTQGYESSASMRFDIPNANDPEGNYGGAIFRIDGAGRNLTGFDALTFWAKASQGVSIGEFGFGQDFGENKFQVTMANTSLSTNWTKYVIPIPDPSKLIEERGMFWYSAGTQNTNGAGYTFWIDELKFEKLGTLAQPQPIMLDGNDVTEKSFIGININLAERGLTQTFNLASGINQTVSPTPFYFNFESSNPDVISVNEEGIVTILDSGEGTITATIDGVEAKGSLTIESLGDFDPAPTPTRDAANVISVFSDAYTNVAVDYYNGFFTPDGQTTLGGAPPINVAGNQVISYTLLNFVGIGFFDNVPSVNASLMTHIHVDINVQETIQSGDYIKLQLLNSVGDNETSGTYQIDADELITNQWVGFDVPLSDFTGLTDKSKLGLFFFISDNTISSILVDNIYFYKE